VGCLLSGLSSFRDGAVLFLAFISGSTCRAMTYTATEVRIVQVPCKDGYMEHVSLTMDG
jgi:hypothetical protein